MSEDEVTKSEFTKVTAPLASRLKVFGLATTTKEGFKSSTTVTVTVVVAVFKEPSVAVKVTVFVPKLVQSNEVLLRITVGVPQLSEDDKTTSALVSVAAPEAFRMIVAFLPTTAGLVTSLTVTTDVCVVMLPEPSVDVTVTLFAPRSLHVNEDLLKVTVGVPQLSEEVTTTFEFTKVAEPDASRLSV